MKYSTNEWGTLKSVIVGDATDATLPDPADISVRTVNYADVTDDTQLPEPGRYPQQVIDEANEDLEILAKFLEGEGVEVRRPAHHTATQYYDFCPRDVVFVHGEHVIATPMPIRARATDWQNLAPHFDYNQLKHWDSLRPEGCYNAGAIGDPDTLALTEQEPLFDAANIIRAGDDILYLVSNSGNRLGAWRLQQALGTDVKVHTLEDVYSYMHIDSTIAFLREGLMLVNPSRVKDRDQLPEAFRNWDIIWAPEPVDIGHYPGYCNSSAWVSVNLFSVNPNLVVLEEHQHNLRVMLEQQGIDCAMLPARHARTLGGCFHCVTLDLERADD